MKIRIVKKDNITELTVQQDQGKRPPRLDQNDLQALIQLLALVRDSKEFTMEYEVR